MPRRFLAVFIGTLVFASTGTSLAQKKQAPESEAQRADKLQRARTHLERGVEFYAEKQYELAIVEFRAGYALDPRPDFLFALAQAERLAGDCASAVVYYRRFIESTPPAEQADAARINLQRCERALGSGPAGRPEQPTDKALEDAEGAAPSEAQDRPPEPRRAEPAPAVTASIERAAEKPWYMDVAGGSMAAGGVVSLAVGVGFLAASGAAEDDATRAVRYDDYVDYIATARQRRTLGVVGLAAGTALVGAAVVRYLTLDEAPGERDGGVVAGPTPDGGAMVGFSGFF